LRTISSEKSATFRDHGLSTTAPAKMQTAISREAT
jgi:hypothetical protein